jgi:hemoglobin-like flavoprotein
VGGALIATLETGLGDDFTPQVRDAWTACYTAIAAEMAGAAEADAPRET